MKKTKNIEQLSTFKTPTESPGYLLWHVSLLWKSSIEETLKNFELTHPQFVVLATTAWLTRNGGIVNQIDISQASGLDPNTTSQVLRGLEAKNYIQRTRSINERNKNPQLTMLGSSILAQALPTVEAIDSTFFNILTAKELNTLITLFQKITKNT